MFKLSLFFLMELKKIKSFTTHSVSKVLIFCNASHPPMASLLVSAERLNGRWPGIWTNVWHFHHTHSGNYCSVWRMDNNRLAACHQRDCKQFVDLMMRLSQIEFSVQRPSGKWQRGTATSTLSISFTSFVFFLSPSLWFSHLTQPQTFVLPLSNR